METGPSNLVLEQLMVESQGEWMTINHEGFSLWSFRQPVVSVQFANVLGRVVNVWKFANLLLTFIVNKKKSLLMLVQVA